jgi:hypothetical protein
MKKYVPFLLFILWVYPLFSQNNREQYNYGNGNGTIIEETTINGNKCIIRKHETKEMYIGTRFNVYDELFGDYNRYYDSEYKKEHILFQAGYSDRVDTLAIAIIEHSERSLNTICIKIKDNQGRVGWIYSHASDPYRDGNGSILEIITICDKKWTIRNAIRQGLYWGFAGEKNVRDRPGLIETNILFQLQYTDTGNLDENMRMQHLTVLAITEEKDTFTITKNRDLVEDVSDFWVKIRDIQGREGWVFGGYLIQGDRGGPKLYTPDELIQQILFPA